MTELIQQNNQSELATTEIQSSRQAQEVQAAVIMAKRFPRDETAAYDRIIKACKRKGLAEVALYSYPKGGQQVEGPSIRLAEVLARAWGNLEYGTVELSRTPEASEMLAFCWDLETNVRKSTVFTVSHLRQTKTKSYLITDPRDVYENTANNASRRVRACILAVIPGDITEAAQEQINKTLAGKSSEPLSDRSRKMVVAFAELGVTQEQLEAQLSHPLTSMTETELVRYQKLYTAIKDGHTQAAEAFPSAVSRTEKLAKDLKDKTPATIPASEPDES